MPPKAAGRKSGDRQSPPPPPPPSPDGRTPLELDRTIAALPPEILLRIFCHLSGEDLYGSVARVCRLWQHLAFLARPPRLSFRGDVIDTEVVCRALRGLPDLQALRLEGRCDASEILRAVAKHNGRIRCLVLRQRSTPVDSRILCNLIKRCRNIEELTVQSTYVSGHAFLRKIGACLPNLKIVNFKKVPNLDYRDRLSIVSTCPQLQEIGLYKHSFSLSGEDDNVIDIISTRMQHSLKVVKLTGKWIISYESLIAIAKCQNLIELQIEGSGYLSINGFEPLTALLNLQCLKLKLVTAYPNVSVQVWTRCFQGEHLRNLRILRLEAFSISDDVVRCVAASCPNLEKLHLIDCSGLTGRVKDNLAGCSKLREFIFYGNADSSDEES